MTLPCLKSFATGLGCIIHQGTKGLQGVLIEVEAGQQFAQRLPGAK
jgi:hypothetical protein